MAYDNEKRGALFVNDKKRDDRDADYSGKVQVEGVEYWMDGWKQKAKTSGKTFLSIRLRPKSDARGPDNDDVDQPDDEF